MKTYNEIIEKNRLEISYDEFSENPRHWSNLGYFITVDRNYNSPDKNEMLENIVKETGQEAESRKEHIEKIKNEVKKILYDEVVAIYPIFKYEHSGIAYKIGTAHGFDYSNNGFYIVTKKTKKEMGAMKKDFEKIITEEIDFYNRWLNGEVYSYVLYDENGEVEDSCGGFYEVENIRNYLPEDWKDEELEKYIID